MRPETKRRIVRVLTAPAVLTLLVGCQIPGGSFGHDPLQLRAAALTRSAIEAEPQPVETDRYVPPTRMTAVEPVTIAAGRL